VARKRAELEGRVTEYDERIDAIFEAIRKLMTPPERERKRIGFEVNEPPGMQKGKAGGCESRSVMGTYTIIYVPCFREHEKTIIVKEKTGRRGRNSVT
jgi:hypothetical protein